MLALLRAHYIKLYKDVYSIITLFYVGVSPYINLGVRLFVNKNAVARYGGGTAGVRFQYFLYRSGVMLSQIYKKGPKLY